MEKKGCLEVELNAQNYSSPIPLIGLYVAAATLVCLALILSDLFVAFRNRRRWLPCQFFSINSVTLTLLSIAAKLPLDLTTPMPSVEDQLSKLTGTTMICICMGFFVPSLGTYRYSESLTNMAALSIFVVTVVVNICIQLHTGVIILFRVEHIITLCCLVLLLMILWFCTIYIPNERETSASGIKEHLTKGHRSMLHRLKVSYLYSFDSNPQFYVVFKTKINVFVSQICMLCLVVLTRVAIQALVSKELMNFCGEISDYKWSMKAIVVSQIIIVVVGGLGATSRFISWFILMHLENFQTKRKQAKDAEYIILRNPILQSSIRDSCITVTKVLMHTLVTWVPMLVILPYTIVVFGFMDGCCRKDRDSEGIEEFKGLIHRKEMGLEKWTLRNGLKDMKRWMEENKTNNTIDHLVTLLQKVPRPISQEPSIAFLLRKFYDSEKPAGYKMSTLAIVIVARIADISIPSSLGGSLLLTSLNEVFEIIQFVDRKTMSSSTFENRNKSKLAKALLESKNFNDHLLCKIIKKSQMGAFRSQSDLHQALDIIRGLKGSFILPSDFVSRELAIIAKFILQQVHESIEDLCRYMEQLFVDMLNEYLVQLPNAIFKEIIESHSEDCEDRVKFTLKVVCKIEKLEDFVQWSFPEATTITHLISDEVPNRNNCNSENSTTRTTHAPHLTRVFRSRSASATMQHEVIQVE